MGTRQPRSARVSSVTGNGRAERRRRPVPTGDAREILEAWLPTGPVDVWALSADLTMLSVMGDWSPLALEATRLVDEATSTGWADHRLVVALREALASDARGELPELPPEYDAIRAKVQQSANARAVRGQAAVDLRG